MAKFKRVLLKLSGESLQGEQGYGIDVNRLNDYARQIKEIVDMGVQVGIVIGGGNIFRGLSGASKGFDRVKGDQMGMLATVINSMALSSALQGVGQKSLVLTAIRMEPVGEFYIELLPHCGPRHRRGRHQHPDRTGCVRRPALRRARARRLHRPGNRPGFPHG